MQGNVKKKKNSGYTMRSFLASQPPLGNDPNSEEMFCDFSCGLDKMGMMQSFNWSYKERDINSLPAAICYSFQNKRIEDLKENRITAPPGTEHNVLERELKIFLVDIYRKKKKLNQYFIVRQKMS